MLFAVCTSQHLITLLPEDTARLDNVGNVDYLQEYVSSLQQQVGDQEKELQQLKADKHMAQRVGISSAFSPEYRAWKSLTVSWLVQSPKKNHC